MSMATRDLEDRRFLMSLRRRRPNEMPSVRKTKVKARIQTMLREERRRGFASQRRRENDLCVMRLREREGKCASRDIRYLNIFYDAVINVPFGERERKIRDKKSRNSMHYLSPSPSSLFLLLASRVCADILARVTASTQRSIRMKLKLSRSKGYQRWCAGCPFGRPVRVVYLDYNRILAQSNASYVHNS